MSDLPLVSVITPCCNGEAFLDRYFRSVLSQTYPNIELIFVNDGSSDRTEEIALSYREALEARGIRYVYIAQENTGVCGALSAGLQHFRGDYLTWPDSDDWMTPDCIEKKAAYLEAHPEKGLVLCQTNIVREDAPDRIESVFRRVGVSRENIFEDLLFERDVFYAPVGWMVRASAFLSALPSRRIDDFFQVGQNIPSLIPVAYRCPCGFLPEPLAYYLIREGSLSRRGTGYDFLRDKAVRKAKAVKAILSGLDMPDRTRRDYEERVDAWYGKMRLRLAMQYHRKDDLRREYAQLRETRACAPIDTLRFLRGNIPLLDAVCGPALRLWVRLRRGK